MNIALKPSKTAGRIQPPSSKSLCHRAMICAGLAEGVSLVSGISPSRDIEATIDCLKSLQAEISVEKTEANGDLTLKIRGSHPASLDQPVTLDAYESGSTLRFFIPIAASGSEEVTFLGQPTLLSRPMGIYADLFLRQNLPFSQSGEKICFHGPLQPGVFEIPGNISSQFVSGLLMASPLLADGTAESAVAVLPPYQSRSYTSLTVDMMKRFGVRVEEPSEYGYLVPAGQSYKPAHLQIEADYSQAAFFAVLGALQDEITIENLNPDSAQGDSVIVSLVEKAGASLFWDGWNLTVRHDRLFAFDADLADCPDLGPILFVLAAFCEGTSHFTHAARLRYKECDRIAAMEDELKKWGVSISSDEDSVTITGKASYAHQGPVVIDAHNDHRIVMAMSVFGCLGQAETIIENASAINKSYPRFFEDLKKLGAKVESV